MPMLLAGVATSQSAKTGACPQARRACRSVQFTQIFFSSYRRPRYSGRRAIPCALSPRQYDSDVPKLGAGGSAADFPYAASRSCQAWRAR